MHPIYKVFRSPLFWIMLLAVAAAIFGYVQGKERTNPDTPTYIRVSCHLGEVLCGNVDVIRTPTYPMFLACCRFIAGESHFMRFAVTMQYLISLISVLVFYHICQSVFRSRWCGLFACAVYIGIVSYFGYNNWITTESLSISATVFFFYGLISFSEQRRYYKAALTGLGLFLMVMLRPAFSVFVPVTFLFYLSLFVFFRETRKQSLTGMISTLCAFVLVLGYSGLVYKKCGSFSPTWISVYNQMFCIAQAGLYENGSDIEINKMIRVPIENYKAEHTEEMKRENWFRDRMLFEYFSTKESPLYYLNDSIWKYVSKDKKHYEKVSDYVSQTIRNHKAAYAYYVIQKMLLWSVYSKKFTVLFGTMILSSIIWLSFLRKVSLRESILHCSALLFVGSTIFTSFAFAMDDYGRLITSVISLFILTFFLIIDRLLYCRPFQFRLFNNRR